MHFHRLSIVMMVSIAGLAAGAHAQDSVPITPGGNDALLPYDATSQRVRYVVDAVAVQTSWGNELLVAPVLKASRDADPLFRTLILGSLAASPSYLESLAFASRSFSVWSAPGQGVHPTANSPGAMVALTNFEVQFGIAASEFGMTTSSVLGATVGLDMDTPSRLYVERVMALASRASAAGADTATLSLGAVDAAGMIALRADNFNTIPATATRVLGENLLRVNTPARSGSANSLAAFGGTNFASDTGSTTFVVSNETIPTNTPTIVGAPTSAPFVLGLDFASRFRAGSTTANLVTTTAHLALGVAGHRGNPTFSPFAAGGGRGLWARWQAWRARACRRPRPARSTCLTCLQAPLPLWTRHRVARSPCQRPWHRRHTQRTQAGWLRPSSISHRPPSAAGTARSAWGEMPRARP